jgi:hypothetical protein
MDFAPRDVHHRGYRIVWDARPVPGTGFWTGKAAVVAPLCPGAAHSVYPLGELDGFDSEEDARNHLIRAAMEWIDRSSRDGNAV